MIQTVILKGGQRVTIDNAKPSFRYGSEAIVLSMQKTAGGAFYEWNLTRDEAEALALMLRLATMPKGKVKR